MCSEAKRIKSDSPCDRVWTLKPILSDEVLADIPQEKVFVDKIKNKKYISSIISHLNKMFPVPSLQHLKRVRGDEILIDLAVLDETEQRQLIREKLATIEVCSLGLSLDPYISLVPGTQPRTKAQFKSCNCAWPCNFHPDKTLEETISGDKFNEEALESIETWMKKCLELCKHCGVGCVVVDAESNQLIASGVHETKHHPMKHATMVAIDNVAKTQNGGAWSGNCLVESGAVTTFTNNSTTGMSLEDSVAHESNTYRGDGPYLCTGYDVYITAEPCLMCAMALVHSRAKRIFYGCPNSGAGALGSRLKLHTIPNLNHHYEVYAGVLETECRQAFVRMNPDP